MKRIFKTILVLSIASVTVFSSCKKSEEEEAAIPDATVTITPSPTGSITVGDVLTLTIQGTGSDKNQFSELTLTRSDLTAPLLQAKKVSGAMVSEVYKDTTKVAGEVTYTVTMKAAKNSPVASYKVNIKAAPKPTDKTNTPVPLFAQNNSGGGTNNHFIKGTSTFDTYSLTTYAVGKTTLDLVFYYGDNNKATITSPTDNVMRAQIYSGLDWTGTKDTKLHLTSLSEADFNAIVTNGTDAGIMVEADKNPSYVTAVTQLAVGKVILFKTAAGKYGLALVKTLTGAASTTGYIELSIVAQQ
jgi:hypothetical protein